MGVKSDDDDDDDDDEEEDEEDDVKDDDDEVETSVDLFLLGLVAPNGNTCPLNDRGFGGGG